MSYEDWLDGLEKTLENSIIKRDLQDNKDVFIINPCPLSTITKQMADVVAANFKLLFEWAGDEKAVQNTLKSETVSVVENFTRASYTFGLLTVPHDSDWRMAVSMWLNCTYTIAVTEQLLRVDEKPLFGQLTLKQTDLLSNIVKQAALYGINQNVESVRTCCVRLLANILRGGAPRDESVNIMDVDMFYLLVALCLSMPNLYADNSADSQVEKAKLSTFAASYGGLNDLNVLTLVLQAHCVQILLTKIKLDTFLVLDRGEKMEDDTDAEEEDLSEKVDISESDQYESEANLALVHAFYKHVLNLIVGEKGEFNLDAEKKAKLLTLSPKVVSLTLKHALMPFLRCAALFFANLTGLAPSIEITHKPGKLECFGDISHFYIEAKS